MSDAGQDRAIPARSTAPSVDRDGLWLLLAVLAGIGFAGLTLVMLGHPAFPLDRTLVDAAHAIGGSALIWQVVSQTANIPLIVLGVGFVLWLLWRGHRREAVLVIGILVAITAGSEAVKQVTAIQRPAGNGAGIPGVVYSYPSGHILECLVILGMITVRVWRTSGHRTLRVILAVAVVVEVVLVGFARMALLEHFPSDVLGGLLGGLAALGLYAWSTRPGGWAGPDPHRTTA